MLPAPVADYDECFEPAVGLAANMLNLSAKIDMLFSLLFQQRRSHSLIPIPERPL
ncbi:hypothetical protein Psta_3679 [Pirellula staleyi DSM 6068]|uniref:Uncharacterized protein n=1 Tax=Pirellula staleyi (strain ATCC 27377 / DSM 6068 / ICPB 4128) TaxID=530564 RepID=D2QZX2_PIRSD|nr:hypothetical protein Psta_3679 [Pirellula staleyi DSM 6068]